VINNRIGAEPLKGTYERTNVQPVETPRRCINHRGPGIFVDDAGLCAERSTAHTG
jgi:hypothetical protein